MNDYSNSKVPLIFEILDNNGITQKQLAEAIQVSTGNISDWKSGKSAPKPDALSKIADFLNCSVDFLLGRTQNSNKNFDMFTLALSQLNKNGQEMAYDYIDTLVKSGKYSPDSKNDTIGIAAKGGRTATTADNTAVDAEIAKRKRRKL